MNPLCSRLAIVVIATLIPSLAAAQPASPEMRARHAADSVAAAMLRDSVAGVVIGVFRGAQPVFVAAYGLADLSSARAMRADEVLPIASITKQLTAAAVLALVDDSRVALDDPVTRYMPELGETFTGVTVRQLLNQTSGIGRYESAFQLAPPSSTADVVRVIAAATKEFAPGARFGYNNANYYLLGALIESVTGQPWDAFLHTRFFEQLGMVHTGMCPDGEHGALPTGYMIFGRRVVRPFMPATMTAAAGGLCSTASDLGRWSNALHGGRLLSPGSVHALTTPSGVTAGEQVAYGMGAVASELDGHRELWHNGGVTSGFSSMLAHYPDDSLTVVVLANSFPARPEPPARAVARAWLGDSP